MNLECVSSRGTWPDLMYWIGKLHDSQISDCASFIKLNQAGSAELAIIRNQAKPHPTLL